MEEGASIQAFPGHGKSIEEAIEDAWNKATAERRDDAPDERTLRVVEISVTGRNPISGYGVVLIQ